LRMITDNCISQRYILRCKITTTKQNGVAIIQIKPNDSFLKLILIPRINYFWKTKDYNKTNPSP
jgi:hypothetical protein